VDESTYILVPISENNAHMHILYIIRMYHLFLLHLCSVRRLNTVMLKFDCVLIDVLSSSNGTFDCV